MKTWYLPFILLIVLILSSCASNSNNEKLISFSTCPSPMSGYNYIFYTDCGSGALFKKESCIWYYDYESQNSFSLCSNPSCKHNNKDCAAYYAGRNFIFKDKIIEVKNNSKEWNEKEGFKVNAILNISDFSGYNRKSIMELDYAFIDTYAYDDSLFIGCEEAYYEEDSDLYVSPDKARIYLMEISLDTLETVFISECLVDGYSPRLSFKGINNGELYFNVLKNNQESDTENFEPIWQEMKYDLNLKKISAADKQIDFCSENCIAWFDDNITNIVTNEKVVQLKSDIYLDYIPLNIDVSDENNIYFRVFGNDDSVFKLNFKDEILYEAQLDGIGNSKVISVFKDNYFIKTDKNISTINNEDLVFKEIDSTRYNEVCEHFYNFISK